MAKLNINQIALNEREWSKGLMHTNPLADDQCALFVFDSPRDYSFWNFDVSYPIDVAFFDDSATLIHVGKLDAHQTTPVKSGNKIKYVVETSVDWFNKNNITLGSNLWNLVNLKLKASS